VRGAEGGYRAQSLEPADAVFGVDNKVAERHLAVASVMTSVAFLTFLRERTRRSPSTSCSATMHDPELEDFELFLTVSDPEINAWLMDPLACDKPRYVCHRCSRTRVHDLSATA
jgi:hypothetical protein